MGHDISGYLKADTEQSNEIAYLRRGAGNPLARTIYAALRHPEFDAGVSGGGFEATFTNEYLRDALGRLPDGADVEPERKFLNDCIAANGDVTITFF